MEVPRFTRVRAVLDTQFDECSTLASATRAKAIGLITNGTVTSEQFLVSDFGNEQGVMLRKVEIIPSATGPGFVDTDGSAVEVNFAVMEDVNTVTGLYSPKLLAVVDNDVSVPIASFDRRSQAECSHVQIGSEMKDDNIVATNKATRRLQLQAINTLLDGENWTEEQRTAIIEVIKEEIARCRIEFSQARKLSFVRYMLGILQGSSLDSVKEMIVLGDEVGTSFRRVLSYSPATPPSIDQRYTNRPTLLIAQPTQEGKMLDRFSEKRRHAARELGGISLFACVRDEVLLELLNVSASGEITGLDEDRPVQMMQAVRNFFNYVGPFINTYERLRVPGDRRDFYSVSRFRDAQKTIIGAKGQLFEHFGVEERLDKLLGGNRRVVDSLIAVAKHRIARNQQDMVIVLPPGTEFSSADDSARLQMSFAKRAGNALGVVCYVKPAAADMQPVETYNETIFIDKPNSGEQSANYNELLRLFKLVELVE